MIRILLGAILVIATATTFWRMRPVSGVNYRFRTNPNWEPYIVLGFLTVMTLGFSLILIGFIR